MTDKEQRKVRIPSANFGDDLHIFADDELPESDANRFRDSPSRRCGDSGGGDDGRAMSWDGFGRIDVT